MSTKFEKKKKSVILVNALDEIPNIYDLPKVGAGHDGIVFRYNDLALKLVKYDINQRKEKKLMTFDKARYFENELILKRIVAPIDTMLDEDGVYTGYVMQYLEDVSLPKNKKTSIYREVGDFTCGDLMFACAELQEDFSLLTEKGVCAKDINRGSYIFTQSFLNLCDMDKYDTSISTGINNLNNISFNFVIAKLLYLEMLKQNKFDKFERKVLSKWVKRCSNSVTFIKELNTEIGHEYTTPIKEYANYKVKKIIRQSHKNLT